MQEAQLLARWATSRPRLAAKVTPSPHPGHGAYKGTLWDPVAKIGAGQVAGNSNLKLGDRPPAPVLRPGPATGPLLSQFFLLGQKAAMLLVRPLGGSCRSSLLIGA